MCKKKSKLDRRKFLKLSALGTCGTAAHLGYNPFGTMNAWADTAGLIRSGRRTLFVNVWLAGGASLNVAPHYLGAYYDKQPNASYGPGDSFPISATRGIHPSLTVLHNYWNAGKLIFFDGVSWENHSRSHADATEQYGTGGSGGSLSGQGILSIANDQFGQGLATISLAGQQDLVRGGSVRSLSGGLSSLGFSNFNGENSTEFLHNIRKNLLASDRDRGTPAYGVLRDQINALDASLETIREQTNNPLPDIGEEYPDSNGFVGQCIDALAIANAPILNTKQILLNRGSWDTHGNDLNNVANNLNDINSGMYYLTRGLDALVANGTLDEYVILFSSEFGRTFTENTNRGTDHGNTAATFAFGNTVVGQYLGNHLTDAQIAQSHYWHYRDRALDYHIIYDAIFKRLGLDTTPILSGYNPSPFTMFA